MQELTSVDSAAHTTVLQMCGIVASIQGMAFEFYFGAFGMMGMAVSRDAMRVFVHSKRNLRNLILEGRWKPRFQLRLPATMEGNHNIRRGINRPSKMICLRCRLQGRNLVLSRVACFPHWPVFEIHATQLKSFQQFSEQSRKCFSLGPSFDLGNEDPISDWKDIKALMKV